MAIQKVWLHGRGCDCGLCDPNDESHIQFMDKVRDIDSIGVSSKTNTRIRDQHGQMYIITPMPYLGSQGK